MITNRILLFSLIHIMTIFRVSLLETVHFTNSPHKILKANNFTTYKVEVPNGDPITIIEGNSPLIDKKIQFNEIKDPKTRYSISHNEQRGSHVMDLKTSLSMTVTPNDYNLHNSAYENLNISPSAVDGDEESVANDNDYHSLSPEHAYRLNQGIKTVYSPELLEKFLKDYANKIQTNSVPSRDQNKMNNPLLLENISSNKYASVESNLNQNNHKDEGGEEMEEEDTNRRVSSIGEDSAASASNDIQERKQYRPNTGYGYGYSNKNSGWVSLDPVPWSKTKVSKWQSYVKPQSSQNQNQNPYNYQQSSGNGGGTSYNVLQNNKPTRPSYIYEDGNDDYSQRPGGRPTFHNNQFYMGGVNGMPSRPPNDNRYTYFTTASGYDAHEQQQRPPSRPEIITDNRPSNFPQHSGEHHHSAQPAYRPRPDSYDRPSRPFNDYQFSSSGPSSYYSNKDSAHPITYPNSGADGEWVLVSTTKGYQNAKRHGQRAMLLQAQNGFVNDDGLKSSNGIITASASQPHEMVIKPPNHYQHHHQAGPTQLMNQQMKLTVLPLTVVDGNYQSNSAGVGGMEVNKVYKPPQYNGIIEADPSPQTIEESVAAAAHANEYNSMVVNSKPTKKKVRKYNKNYTIMRKNSGNDSASVLAAVGAGLLPASLGLIAPMMLGRKK